MIQTYCIEKISITSNAPFFGAAVQHGTVGATRRMEADDGVFVEFEYVFRNKFVFLLHKRE